MQGGSLRKVVSMVTDRHKFSGLGLPTAGPAYSDQAQRQHACHWWPEDVPWTAPSNLSKTHAIAVIMAVLELASGPSQEVLLDDMLEHCRHHRL
jgi:hypothetical protein